MNSWLEFLLETRKCCENFGIHIVPDLQSEQQFALNAGQTELGRFIV